MPDAVTLNAMSVQPTLSACLIVKNEEAYLEQCLNSIKDLVDEIIVVDTGSSDRTKEIAKSFEAKVYDFVWCNDFSAARNESLKHATGDWILVIDADETLAKKDHERIKGLIQSTKLTGFILTQRNYIKSLDHLQLGLFNNLNVREAGHGNNGFVKNEPDFYEESITSVGWLPTPIVRLFRNLQGVAFSGVVHEDVSPSLQGKVIKSDIPIHHFGKLDAVTWKRKWDLYESLAEKKVDEEKDYFAYFELGRQYLAAKKFAEAKKMFLKSIELQDNFWLAWANLGSINLIQENVAGAIKHLELARLINPNALMIYTNLGTAYAMNKQYQKAIDIFTLGLNLDVKQPSIFKNMALCYREIGDNYRAGLAWKKAVGLNPSLEN